MVDFDDCIFPREGVIIDPEWQLAILMEKLLNVFTELLVHVHVLCGLEFGEKDGQFTVSSGTRGTGGINGQFFMVNWCSTI